jgi:hypothetical protein
LLLTFRNTGNRVAKRTGIDLVYPHPMKLIELLVVCYNRGITRVRLHTLSHSNSHQRKCCEKTDFHVKEQRPCCSSFPV